MRILIAALLALTVAGCGSLAPVIGCAIKERAGGSRCFT